MTSPGAANNAWGERSEVSVIIPTRNGVRRVGPTIDSVLEAIDTTQITVELLVVDNGSTDGTAATVKDQYGECVRIVSVEEQGSANAKNGGVKTACGRVLLFLDDDVRVPSNWVHAMAEPILNDEAAITCGAVHLAPHLLRHDLTPYHLGLLADTCEGLGTPPRTVFGASMGVSRAVFDTGIWFHPALGPGQAGFMEEHIWFMRAMNESFRALWVDSAPVEHHVDADRLHRSAWLRRAAAQGRSEALGAKILGEPTTRFTVASGLRASARRARYWFADRRSAVPSMRYLETVRMQQVELAGLRLRLRSQ